MAADNGGLYAKTKLMERASQITGIEITPVHEEEMRRARMENEENGVFFPADDEERWQRMRLIDADVLMKEPVWKCDGDYRDSYYKGYQDALYRVEDFIGIAPTVEAVPVVHGRWISDEGDVLFHCSECETQISTSWDYDDLHWNYCPNCGAKMDGGEDNG